MSTGNKVPKDPPHVWAKSEDGRDFTAELHYHAEDQTKAGKPTTRGDIGQLLGGFGISSTGEYISHFKDVLTKAGHKVV